MLGGGLRVPEYRVTPPPIHGASFRRALTFRKGRKVEGVREEDRGVGRPVDALRPLAWHGILDGPLPGALNMARDHALASSHMPEAAVLRLYRWARPTLSLGRNEPALEVYAPDRIRELGLDVVRRPTGGRAVLHGRELTYAVVVPDRALGGPRSAYRWINARIASALAALGTAAEIAGASSRAAPLSAGACFASPAEGEVVSGERKLVGSAQLRVGGALLQHGSILLADDQELVRAVTLRPGPRTDRPATVSELLGREVAVDEIEDAVLAAFGLERGGCAHGSTSASPEEAGLEERYRSDAWTWRR